MSGDGDGGGFLASMMCGSSEIDDDDDDDAAALSHPLFSINKHTHSNRADHSFPLALVRSSARDPIVLIHERRKSKYVDVYGNLVLFYDVVFENI